MERSFPEAFVDRVNSLGLKDIKAEPVSIDMVEQGVGDGYAVIIDRISQDVPFYRAYLKNAAIDGAAVLNNPFWWSADEKFFNNALALKIGVPVPKTVILPSHERPPDTSEGSFPGSRAWTGPRGAYDRPGVLFRRGVAARDR